MAHSNASLIAYNQFVTSMGKLLIGAGGVLIVVGIVVLLAGRANIPIGRLPGDISYRGKNTSVFFPIATCIILSVILSVVMWLINRLR